jgi:phenylpropionate dioxygenase-like ring-hydroxylating dioxygenase large terminal subunit
MNQRVTAEAFMPVTVALPEIISPDHYGRELNAVFRKAWLPIAYESEVPAPNSYYVVDMPTFRTSLIVARGPDEQVRVFYNICRHRGNKLVRAGKGCSRLMQCGFHAWSYSTNGGLAGVPDQDQFGDLDKSSYGLLPVRSEVWEGIVFVTFDPSPKESLREWLGVLYDQFGGFASRLEKVSSWRITVRANWHVCINAFQEAYHTLYLHKQTVPDYMGGRNVSSRHRLHMEFLKHQTRYSTPANPDHNVTPLEKAAFSSGLKLFPEFRVDASHLPVGINPSRAPNWAFDITHFFPNFHLMVGAHWAFNYWFWPVDSDTTWIWLDTYAAKARSAAERLAQSFMSVRIREVFREDVNTLEATQSVLASGVMPHIVLSRQESAIARHYTMLSEMLAEAAS